MQNVDIIKEVSLNMWVEIGMAISLVGVGYIVGLVKKQLRMQKKTLKVSWTTHSQIHELLTELRINVDAARSQIIQFHNGEYFMDGISMKKFSLTHESLSKGVSEEGERLNNMLISLFTPLMEKVIKDEPIVYKTVEDEHGLTRNLMQTSNTVAYSVLPLRHKNMISGYIIINWCSEAKIKRINSEEIAKYLTEARDFTEVYLKDILREENI